MFKRFVPGPAVQRSLLLILLGLALVLELNISRPPWPVLAQEAAIGPVEGGGSLQGRLLDAQGEPIHDADVAVLVNGDEEPLVHAASQMDGSYLLDLPRGEFTDVVVEITRPHFRPTELHLEAGSVAVLNANGSVRLPDLQLERRMTPGFWVATLSFVLVLVLIALERLHKTTAALLGVCPGAGHQFRRRGHQPRPVHL